jgi:hypothetical protein
VRIGASLILIAIGAILRFAVTAQVNGIHVGTVGVVLMVVGIAGLVISLVLLSSRRRTDVIHHSTGATYVEPVDPDARRY